jgi:hypothetical protein
MFEDILSTSHEFTPPNFDSRDCHQHPPGLENQGRVDPAQSSGAGAGRKKHRVVRKREGRPRGAFRRKSNPEDRIAGRLNGRHPKGAKRDEGN